MSDGDSARFVAALGAVLVVAPHPDDESIGCGGLIALLRAAGQGVSVVLVSDGMMSHPGSRRFGREARGALRVAELREALDRLGVGRDRLVELGCPDGAVPGPGDAGFDAAVGAMRAALAWSGAATVVTPWRRDPHRDHRAAGAIVRAAIAGASPTPRLIEYPVWAAERARPDEQPQPGEAICWRLGIGAAVERKLAAIDAHRSQWGGVIDDDPEGFTLPASMRARAAEPVETYIEVLPP